MEPLCLVHDELDWMRASLDGLSFDGSTVLEIKCPMNVEGQTAAKQANIPPQYYAQLQHQLEVSRAAEVHYWSFNGSSGSLIRVSPDREYRKRLVEAEARFWQLVKGNIWPEVGGEELDLSADPKWREIAVHYRQAKLRLDAASAEEGRLRAILENLATARRTFGCGVELLRSSRKGAVDYAAIPELRGSDLDVYRKPPVTVVRINIPRRRFNKSYATVLRLPQLPPVRTQPQGDTGFPTTCSTTCAFASCPTPARRI